MNYFVTLDDGTVVQVGGVTSIKIVSPLVADGTFRDSPPVVTGGAFAAVADLAETQAISGQIAGGALPTVAIGTTPASLTIIGASSVVQDDSYTHVALRFAFGPIPMIFFTTQNAIAPAPVEADFPLAAPLVNFKVYTADCFFPLDEVKAVSNCPPPGFAVFAFAGP